MFDTKIDRNMQGGYMAKLRIKTAVICQIITILLSSSLSFAADRGDVVVELTAKKVTIDANGKEVLASAEKAAPGDVIEYVATYANKGDKSVKDLLGMLPVPHGMEYIPSTAKPSKVFASLDGKQYGVVPLKRKVRLPNNKEEIREVPPAEYRFLRWDLKNLAPGQRVTVSARMQVIKEPASAAANDSTKQKP